MNAMTLERPLWLRSGGAARVLALLNSDGEEARIVGGAVRNFLMGVPIGDIDIATTAVPDEVIRRVRAAGLKFVPTGVEHGTVTVIADGQPFEVTTLREDVETFGRKAKVIFGRDWERDALRRDFTINALSLSADGTVHDYLNGRADIDARRVRFIGDADRRIAEDYLRILRFFRIHAAYGASEIDRDGLLACLRGRHGLACISAERIRAEMLKLIVADGALPVVTAMADGGLLTRLFAGVPYLGAFAAMISNERHLNLKPEPMLRLGALSVAVTEDARRISTRLRLSKAEFKALDSMGHRWWRAATADEAVAKRRLYRLGLSRYRDRVMLAWARVGRVSDTAHWDMLMSLPDRWAVPAFPLRAADFISRGLAAGPALGHALTLAEDAWLARDFPLDDASLSEIADHTTARFHRS